MRFPTSTVTLNDILCAIVVCPCQPLYEVFAALHAIREAFSDRQMLCRNHSNVVTGAVGDKRAVQVWGCGNLV